MGRKKKTDNVTHTIAKPRKTRASVKKKAKEVELIEVFEDGDTQISIHVQLNDDDVIDDIQMDNRNADFDPIMLDESTQGSQPPELMDEASGKDSTVDDDEPDVVLTEEGNMMIVSKGETIVEHVCAKCEKSFKTLGRLKKHLPSCRSPTDIQSVISIPTLTPEATLMPVSIKQQKEIDYSEIAEELFKDQKKPKAVKNPNFEKYCNPRPSHPCYCCDEDVSTAHNGHIRCKQCPKSFKTNNSFRKHMNSVHSTCLDFQCESCNARCPSQEILDLHIMTHVTGKPFSCTVCGKDFTRKYHLDRHMLHSRCKAGGVDKQKLACDVCNKEFSRVDNLREHLRGHMGTAVRKRDYQCPYCSKSFFGSSLLNIHIRSHTGEKPFPCDLCPKSFPSNGALRKHYRTHTGEKPYECKECKSRFSAKETLNRHMKTHTGVKPHRCEHCDAAFIQRTQLKAHQFVHTGIPLHACTECDRRFSRKNLLNEHMKYDHEGIMPFQCKYCPKMYRRKDDFIRHWKNHKGIKSFECDTCQKGFSLKTSLKLHQRTHVVSPPVECNECGKRFIRDDCLERHKKQKHNGSGVVFEIYTVDGDADNATLTMVHSGQSGSGVMTMPSIAEGQEQADPLDSQITIINETMIGNISAKSTSIKEEGAVKPIEVSKQKLMAGDEIEEGEIMMSQIFSDVPIFMDDVTLKERIQDLLLMLVDEETLTELGWPDKEVDDLLNAIITNCGHQPVIANDDKTADESTKLRENTKLLFTLVIDNDHVKSLLNNYTVDEVIHYVLKVGKI